jgi:hypothetical protein
MWGWWSPLSGVSKLAPRLGPGPSEGGLRIQGDERLLTRHQPRLIYHQDGRWEVRCLDCQRAHDSATPIGIGMPIVNRDEAEAIARNHGDTTARVVS